MPRERTAETLSKIRTPREPAQLLTNDLASFPQLSKPAMNRMGMPQAFTDSVKSV